MKEGPSGKTTFKTNNFSVKTISFSSGKIRYNAIRSNSFREEDTGTSDFFFPRNNNSRLCKTVPVAFLRNHMILQYVLLCFFPNLEIIFPFGVNGKRIAPAWRKLLDLTAIRTFGMLELFVTLFA